MISKPPRPSPASPTTSDASGSTTSTAIAYSQSTYSFPLQPLVSPDFGLRQQPFPNGPNQYNIDPSQYPYNVRREATFPDNPQQPISTPSTVNSGFEDGSIFHSSITTASSLTSGQSPRLIDLLLPGTDLNAPSPDFLDYQPQQSSNPYQPGGYPQVQAGMLDDEDVEEVVRQPDPAEAWVIRLPSPTASSSSSSSEESRFDNTSLWYQQPRMSPGSPEMLMMRFNQQTCGILSVKDGLNENPWRTMIWPLARDSPALYHAISSMTAFHTSKENPGLRVEGMEHMRRSVRYLANGIEHMREDTALATTLVLAFSESWDQHISTGIEHLRGAKILVNQALTKHSRNPLKSEEFARLKFLCNIFVYMDVISRLTSVDDDESEVFDAVHALPCGPFQTNEVDPLLGCASTLFPIIGRVANLVRRVRKSSRNSINIISQASDLKAAIENWQLPLGFEPPEDPTSEIRHSMQTAEAYRWATLLYLHQAVPEIPSQSAAEMAQEVLRFLATVPLSSRATIVQIYPLLAAGCEVSTPEDRKWVENRWAAMMQRMLIGNLDRCWEVIKEVWDRRDAHEADKRRQRHRRAGSQTMPNGFTSPTHERMKRKFKSEDDCLVPSPFDWPEGLGGVKRRTTTQDFVGMDLGSVRMEPMRKSSVQLVQEMDFKKTVRGRLHWLGVMKDWKWEGEFCERFWFRQGSKLTVVQFCLDESPLRIVHSFGVGYGWLRPWRFGWVLCRV